MHVVLFPDQCVLQLPVGWKKQILRFLNALFILLFILSGFLSRANLDNIGVMQKYLPVDSGECTAESVLLWQKAENLEGARRAVLCQGDGVLATAIQYTVIAHQLYTLVRGGGERIRSSLPLGFHRAQFVLEDVKEKASMPTASSSSAEGWSCVKSLPYIYIRPEKFQLQVVFASEWEACGVLDNRKEQREADSSLNIKKTNKK